jgi:hypothetical protein
MHGPGSSAVSAGGVAGARANTAAPPTRAATAALPRAPTVRLQYCNTCCLLQSQPSTGALRTLLRRRIGPARCRMHLWRDNSRRRPPNRGPHPPPQHALLSKHRWTQGRGTKTSVHTTPPGRTHQRREPAAESRRTACKGGQVVHRDCGTSKQPQFAPRLPPMKSSLCI